jgi:hypothetical protein
LKSAFPTCIPNDPKSPSECNKMVDKKAMEIC